MQAIPMDLDGAYVVNRREFSTRWPSPARYARDVAAAFPELGPCAAADLDQPVRRISVHSHGLLTRAEVLDVVHRRDPGPLPSHKVRSRIKSRRQKKSKRRRG